MFLGKPTRGKNAFFAVLCFLLCAFIIYGWATFNVAPPRSTLRTAAGQVSWVKQDKYGIRFGLTDASQSFDYASKGNAMGVVYAALSKHPSPFVAMLYDPKCSTRCGVFEISADGRMIRSYREIADAWRSDENIAPWLAAFMGLSGLYLAWRAVRGDTTSESVSGKRT